MDEVQEVPMDYELHLGSTSYSVVHFVNGRKVGFELNDEALFSVNWKGEMPQDVARALLEVYWSALSKGNGEGYEHCQSNIRKALGL